MSVRVCEQKIACLYRRLWGRGEEPDTVAYAREVGKRALDRDLAHAWACVRCVCESEKRRYTPGEGPVEAAR